MNLFRRALDRLGSIFVPKREPLQYPPPHLVPYMSAEQKRRDREFARIKVWAKRYNSQRIGPPVLKGARLANMQAQCNPKHLTVLCKGARLTWNKPFSHEILRVRWNQEQA